MASSVPKGPQTHLQSVYNTRKPLHHQGKAWRSDLGASYTGNLQAKDTSKSPLIVVLCRKAIWVAL